MLSRARVGHLLPWLLLGWSVGVAAQEAPELAVERASGAETCPDSEALRARVAAIRGASQSHGGLPYEVSFRRVGDGFEASISAARSAASTRVLHAHGERCDALAQAAAVTLSLLLDAEPPPAPQTPEPATPLVEPAPVGAPLLVHAEPTKPAPAHVHATLSAGASLVLGLTRTVLPALIGEVGGELLGVRVGLGLFFSFRQSTDFAPGRVQESLRAGSLRLCLPAAHGRLLRLDVCSGLFVGAFDVEARGYTRDGETLRLWLAAPLELSLALDTHPVRVELSAGAVFSARRPDFSVAGLGAVYDAWPVSPLLSLRLLGDLGF